MFFQTAVTHQACDRKQKRQIGMSSKDTHTTALLEAGTHQACEEETETTAKDAQAKALKLAPTRFRKGYKSGRQAWTAQRRHTSKMHQARHTLAAVDCEVEEALWQVVVELVRVESQQGAVCDDGRARHELHDPVPRPNVAARLGPRPPALVHHLDRVPVFLHQVVDQSAQRPCVCVCVCVYVSGGFRVGFFWGSRFSRTRKSS